MPTRKSAAAIVAVIATLTAPTVLARGAAATPAALPADTVITGAAGSVVVHTQPFRLSVLDSAGDPVLAEVANTPAAPTPYVSADPTPLGSTDGETAPLYEPMTFTVGTSLHAAYPALPWVGNLLVGAVAGVQYAAKAVIAVSAIPDGRRFIVSTNESGRTITVDVTAQGNHFVVDAQLSAGPRAVLADSFTTSAGEAFHGFGGRHDGLDHRGQSFDTWIEEENFGVGPLQGLVGALPGTGGQGYMFPNGPSAAYYVQPQFVSNRGYGFLLDQPDLAAWRMAVDRSDAWTVRAASTHLRYVVAPGAASSVIDELTGITGRQPTPPDWALGPQLDRLAYLFDTPATYLAKVEDDIAQIRRTGLPLSVYRIEGWAMLPTATLRALIDEFHAMGIRVLLYFRPFAAQDLAHTEAAADFTTAYQAGYFTRTRAGRPYVFTSPFVVGRAGLIDFTNPQATAWFVQRIDHALDLGADGFMADFGEQTLPDMYFANGQAGTTMHNVYPVLYQQVVHGALAAYEATHPGRTFFTYNRAGYSGSARYEAANFPGDETTDWSTSAGLASLTPDMLNRAVGGAYGYSTDIGGYEDAITGATSKELFIRWAEWSALAPLFRDHGSADAGTHTPYSYDAQTLAIYESMSRLHQAAASLIQQLWGEADATGMPITRPLWLAYPDDPIAAAQDQEWLLGPDVLVAPIVTEHTTSRSVYLPAGCWVYQPTGTSFAGSTTVTVPADLATLPYFFRCNTTPFVVDD